ncbi:hypothetical protein D3C75_713660 [compost metagenome]
MKAAYPEDQDNGAVDHQGSGGIQQSGDAAHMDGGAGEILGGLLKPLLLLSSFGKGADDPDARQIFAEHGTHPVQLALVAAVQGSRAADNKVQNHADDRSRHQQDQGQPQIQNHRHDNGADADKRRADHQPDQHGDSQLQLVHITGQAVDQG